MTEQDFDELAGRIDGIGQAVLRLAAALERQGVINGPRLSANWREARQHGASAVEDSARRTLHELAAVLDDARSHRRSLGSP